MQRDRHVVAPRELEAHALVAGAALPPALVDQPVAEDIRLPGIPELNLQRIGLALRLKEIRALGVGHGQHHDIVGAELLAGQLVDVRHAGVPAVVVAVGGVVLPGGIRLPPPVDEHLIGGRSAFHRLFAEGQAAHEHPRVDPALVGFLPDLVQIGKERVLKGQPFLREAGEHRLVVAQVRGEDAPAPFRVQDHLPDRVAGAAVGEQGAEHRHQLEIDQPPAADRADVRRAVAAVDGGKARHPALGLVLENDVGQAQAALRAYHRRPVGDLDDQRAAGHRRFIRVRQAGQRVDAFRVVERADRRGRRRRGDGRGEGRRRGIRRCRRHAGRERRGEGRGVGGNGRIAGRRRRAGRIGQRRRAGRDRPGSQRRPPTDQQRGQPGRRDDPQQNRSFHPLTILFKPPRPTAAHNYTGKGGCNPAPVCGAG